MNNTCVQHFSTTVLYRAPQSTIVTCTTMYPDLVVDFHYFYISIKYLWGSHNKRECWKKSKQANKWVRSPGYTWGHTFTIKLSFIDNLVKKDNISINIPTYNPTQNIVKSFPFFYFRTRANVPAHIVLLPCSKVGLKHIHWNYSPDIQKLFYLLYYPRNK